MLRCSRKCSHITYVVYECSYVSVRDFNKKLSQAFIPKLLKLDFSDIWQDTSFMITNRDNIQWEIHIVIILEKTELYLIIQWNEVLQWNRWLWVPQLVVSYKLKTYSEKVLEWVVRIWLTVTRTNWLEFNSKTDYDDYIFWTFVSFCFTWSTWTYTHKRIYFVLWLLNKQDC